MGQNQLLMIILGMVVVGVTVAVAIVLVNQNAITANKDAMAADLMNIAAKAQQYYSTPASMAGGGHSYVGLTANTAGMLRLVSTAFSDNSNGVYSIRTAGTASQVVLQGVGREVLSDGSYPTISCTVTPGNAAVLIEN